ncbi:ABC transporter ATP-binding protein [Streptococcus oralis]|uniref:ABC transporter ATP-binding protein n=1 Tax=Streptococcus oralis TaxID=1303 RepID=UPI001C03BE30|nr:ABC transporter ATP-binding protein [Streptococcus oralis]MBU0454111.1 ABC transporter ATP-binding protein [Streptococcus oralis]MBZ2094348.1 ABC transporter ATP-binding protein [Streptococcus oralis]MBZ2097806.1 ABC transporter ATP-binding protein [Streptococcus oralis]QXW60761.1 ABC transporter ATP-binding protein [Streptococcus oralis]
MTTLIEMNQVTKTYGEGKMKVVALHETNFQLNAGEFVAIVGPSGSGKTTFLTTLGQLQEASSGKILVKGKETGSLTEKEKTDLRFREFGFILQASNLIPFLTVKEQLDLIDRLDKGKNSKSDRKELFDLLDLEKVQYQYPKALSGGERQRAAIARALYNNPSIVLADEPTASLDTERAYQVTEMLAAIAHEQGRGVVMITHDTRLLDKVDRIYVMNDGHLVEETHV